MPNRIDIDFDERGFQAVRAAAKTRENDRFYQKA
jgi:hypothetical protein